MSRLSEDRAPEPTTPLAEAYSEICEVMGVSEPTALFTALSSRPDLTVATWNLFKLLIAKGQLPPSVTQLILLTISARANCAYCEQAHRRALESMGIDSATIDQCLKDPANARVPELHAKIIQFALKAARSPNDITDDEVEKLRHDGLTDGELAETAILVATTRFLNTIAEALEVGKTKRGAAVRSE